MASPISNEPRVQSTVNPQASAPAAPPPTRNEPAERFRASYYQDGFDRPSGKGSVAAYAPAAAEGAEGADEAVATLPVQMPPVGSSRADYVAAAESVLPPKSNPIARNQAITGAYASLYLENPTAFKWAGMASHVSATVGVGLVGAQGSPAAIASGNPFVAAGALVGGKELESFLKDGNNAVFNDIYPAFLAYKNGGAAEVANAGFAPEVVEGFRSIEQGEQLLASESTLDDETRAMELIWQGNEKLLRYEQEVTLDPVYQNHEWTARALSPFMYIAYTPSDVHVFQGTVPGGDIGDFNDRWNWISSDLLPGWQAQDGGNREAQLAKMREFQARGQNARGGTAYP
jgi:hypothetical protein